VTRHEFKNLRRGWGVGQREMAALVGCRTSRTIRKWEAGERDIPESAVILLSLYQRFPPLRGVVHQIRAEENIPPVSDSHQEVARD
jgi:DNA-binding transcriptional regulator YiaG